MIKHLHGRRKTVRRHGRKATAAILSLILMVSMFAPAGPIARATALTYVCGDVTYVYIKNGTKADEVYVHSATLSPGTTINVPGTIPDPDNSSNTLTVNSIGATKFHNGVDSFFDDTVSVPSGVTIDASATSLTEVKSYVGYGKTGITLKLPKTLGTLREYVLHSTDDAGNIIYVDALNASYADRSTYNGVAFHGYKNSSLKDKFGASGFTSDSDKPAGDNIPKYADGSVRFTLSPGGSTDQPTPQNQNGGINPFYAYVNTTDQTYLAFTNLDRTKLPTMPFHSFLGYFDDSVSPSEQVFESDGTYRGWNQPAQQGTDPADPLNEKTLTAYWQATPDAITVRFNKNSAEATDPSGLANTTLSATYGVPYHQNPSDQTTGLPANTFVRTGYTFKGWSRYAGGNVEFTDCATNAVFKENTTLYAIWEMNEYNFVYHPEYPTNPAPGTTGSTSNKTVKYRYSEKDAAVGDQNYYAEGYRFVGWSDIQSSDATTTRTPIGATVGSILAAKSYASTINLYAIWELKSYSVKYYSSDPLYDETAIYSYGTAVNLPTPPSKTGYTFAGWSESPNSGQIKYTADDISHTQTNIAGAAESIDLYARYNQNQYTIRYNKGSYSDENSDSTTYTTTCFYDNSYSVKDAETDCHFTRKGCKFIGWSRDDLRPFSEVTPVNNLRNATVFNNLDGTQFPKTSSLNLTSVNNATVDLYPVWLEISYSITYNNNATNATEVGTKVTSYHYGDVKTLHTLTRPGHYFTGWYDQSNNRVDSITATTSGNLALHANWDNDYVIRLADSNVKTMTAGINGTTTTLVNNGTVTNVSFKGETHASPVERISNITITAVDNQLIKAYKITENTGRILASGTYSDSNAKSTVTDTGSFSFPDSDVTVSVTVKPKEYKITFNLDGGTIIGTTPTSYAYGVGAELPTYVVKDGAKFYGWKNSLGTIVTSISKTQTGDQTFTAVWNDPNVTDLPQGAKAVASANGKIVTITYANKNTEDVNIAAQGIALKGGSNAIQFKTSDGKTYLTTVNYIAATDLPSTIKATYVEGAATATITYSDGTTQTIAVNKYNSDTTLYGTRIYFDGIDGKRYTVIPSATADPNPSASPAPTTNPGSNQKPQPDEYYMISKVSYNVRSGKASATNPYNWNAKSINVKDSVKIYGKSYKVTKITANAFYGMPKLKTLVIGKNVTSVGRNAARDCKKLKTINIYSKILFTMGKNWLKNIAKNAYVYINAPKKQYRKIRDLIRKKSGCPKSTHFRRF